ncbi:LOB domain-containing protein 27-like [Actinidia eriantha]|uniref:LOB domain-containing protein 27-like n=1 Tax=Actinidia eriantha TaxID=165200 RepID=UPI002587AB8D|nr:LOB domain-containing protein 27-like [Actinidia eriantha]
MTLKGGTSQACAACKYQRRRCSSECPLAPYFPPDQPKMFQNAHKLFGVSNILKILKQLNTVQKMEAMRSIIYQANIRDRFPVHGCCWVMSQLQYQIQQAEEELYAVLTQIAFFQQQKQQQQQQEINNNNNVNDSASQLQALSLFHQEAPVNADASALPIASSYPNVAAAYSSGYPDHKDNLVNSFWVQQHPYVNGNNNSSNSNNNNNNNISMAMQSQMVSSPQLIIQQEQAQEYDEMHPFFDTIDDRQSYIDSKEAYDSSSDSSLKDTTQSVEHIADNELKSAAACFSLTSVN